MCHWIELDQHIGEGIANNREANHIREANDTKRPAGSRSGRRADDDCRVGVASSCAAGGGRLNRIQVHVSAQSILCNGADGLNLEHSAVIINDVSRDNTSRTCGVVRERRSLDPEHSRRSSRRKRRLCLLGME